MNREMRYFCIDRQGSKDNLTVINEFMDQLYRDLPGEVVDKTDRLRYNELIYSLLNQYKKNKIKIKTYRKMIYISYR